jgi:cellulose synthase/poly-beta-1,6-N-acetylglucosamine synthase-like glycosyltransferase
MVPVWLSHIVVALYFLAALALLLYGINCYVMVLLFGSKRRLAAERRRRIRNRYHNITEMGRLPVVTTQIAVYNEINVIERIIRSAAAMRYPSHLHEIQVLDDSTDETRQLIDTIVAELKAQGVDIDVLRRENRSGYKAGALAIGLQHARGEVIAVFDADFVPPKDYLLKTMPFFLADSRIGLVQTRWGHLNRKRSLLTRAQSIGIDGHFMVEQSARNWNGLFMNFNGTAGLWRRRAIETGGGWQCDTLTEDMDLSYRVQLAGWQTTYLPDVIVPAEIPEDVAAFKTQQFRWAKGSIQTARKLMPTIWASPEPLFKKIQAFFHLTHYMVHPLMLTLAVLALPVLLTLEMRLPGPTFAVIALLLGLSMVAPTTLYVVSQKSAYGDWLQRIIYLPFLVIIGVGIAVSNTKAVSEALLGIDSGFVRTPKKGDREIKPYPLRLPLTSLLEVLIGTYCTFALSQYLITGKYLIGPFLAVYAAGFLFIGLLSLIQGLRIRP